MLILFDQDDSPAILGKKGRCSGPRRPSTNCSHAKFIRWLGAFIHGIQIIRLRYFCRFIYWDANIYIGLGLVA